MKIELTEPVGKIAAEHPWTLPVLEDLKIDYCCGGQRTLKDACVLAGVPVEMALGALEKADREKAVPGETGGWKGKTLAQVIDHILQKHHTYTKAQLSRLKGLSAKVLQAHGLDHPELRRLEELVRDMTEEMEGHMAKEEEQVFPYLKALEASGGRKEGIPDPFAGGPLDQHPLKVLMWEHGMTGEEWEEIHRLTGDLAPPKGACASFKALYQGLRELEADIHQHVHLENNILFSKVMEKGWLD